MLQVAELDRLKQQCCVIQLRNRQNHNVENLSADDDMRFGMKAGTHVFALARHQLGHADITKHVLTG